MARSKHVQFLPEGIQIINSDWQYLSLNDIAVTQLGKSRQALVGHKITEVFTELHASSFFEAMQQCMKAREPLRLEYHFTSTEGPSGWYDLRIQPCDEGICIYSVDISERMENESKLKKANGLYELLTNISHKIVTVKDENELFSDCCSLALRFGNFKMAWIGLFDKNLEILTMVDQSGIPKKELPLFHEALKQPNEQLAYIVQSGNYFISTDLQNEPGLELWHFYAKKHSIKSCILLPIQKEDKIVGLFNLYSKEVGFSNDEITLLYQITLDISQALDIFEQVKKQQESQKLLLRHEQQFRHTLDHMIEGAQIHDFSWRYTYVNDALVKHSSYKKEELLGYSLMEKYPGIEQTPLFDTLSRCMKERISDKLETEFVFPDGSKANFQLSIQPVPEGIFILSVDLTDQIKEKEKLIKTIRLSSFNSAINQNIVLIDNEKELLDSACRIAYDIGKFKLSWINLIEEGRTKRVSIMGTDDAIIAAGPCVSLFVDDPIFYGTPLGNLISSGKHSISNDTVNDSAFAAFKPELLACGIRSAISLPIKKFGVTVGVFELHSDIVDFFDTEETASLQEATQDISFALKNFERAKRHKATEELVEKNEKRFRALIENSSDIKTLASRNCTIIYVSPSLTKVLGYTAAELLETSLLNLIHPDEVADFITNRNAVLDIPEATFNFQHRKKHKDGRWLWFEGSVTNMLHEPAIGAMVSNFRDITDKKNSEQKQDFDSNNLHALINNTDDLLWSIDREYRLITSNLPFDRIMETLLGSPIEKGSDVLKGGNRLQTARFHKCYERAFSGEHFSIIEHTTSSVEYWSEVSFCPIRKGDEIIGTACHSRDITERTNAEHLLRKSELFTRGILDSLSAHIAVINSEGTILRVNDSWKEFAIKNGDSVLENTGEGSNYFSACQNSILQGDKDAGNVLPKIQQVLEGTLDAFYYEYPCHSIDQERWFSMLVRKFESDEMMVVLSHQDITERRQTENELISNNLTLQKTNHELDRFVYSVSHDLRSPLTSVLGLANLIEAESKERDTLLHITMIRKSITRLDNFIRNILSYSRNNRTEIEITHIPLQQTIGEVIELLCGPKDCEDILFEVTINEDFPFYSDRHRFITIMENLISNAIKYHKPQKNGRYIKIKCQSFEAMLALSIEDNGIGIAPEHQSKIFDMFFRISNTINGSGIGLYIVRESIQRLEGKITVSSKEGKGSCFRIELKNMKP